MKLRIESSHGSPINEYRIQDGRVEFRALDPSGRPYRRHGDEWRLVDEADIELHRALGTVVSEWLDVRLESDHQRAA